MKLKFKKIASVLASTIMLGSTLAFAAAAYPAPFVENGSAMGAIVYGSSAASTDMTAAVDLGASLDKSVTPVTTSSAPTGENIKIETGSEKLNVGEALTNVKTTIISKSDLPNLLSKVTYQSKDGVSYDYDQEIQLAGGLTYTLFGDIDYKDRTPTLGIAKSSNAPILNYTARFVKTVESDVNTNGRLEDIENTDLVLMGKNYKLLNAYNATNIKLELMGGAVNDVMAQDDKKTYTISGKTYDVKLLYVDATGAKFEVNGETTNKMVAGGTQKLKDGTQLGVRELLYQGFAGGVMKAEFSLGAEKLTIENGAKMKLNDENSNDVTCYIAQSNSGSKRTISSITLAWIPNDKYFITQDREAVFPGLKSIKITMGNFTTPKTETIELINSGDKTMYLKAPIKSGDVTIPILYSADGSNITKLGEESSNGALNTGAMDIANMVVFNRTTDRYFVASWASTTEAESYLLKATTSANVPSTGVNSTDIIDAKTGSTLCDDKKPADTCTIGNVVLTITTVDVSSDGTVNITAGTGVSFNKLYTTDGLKVNLPYIVNGTNVIRSYGAVNITSLNGTGAGLTSFQLVFEEADKNHNLGAGNDINATISFASSKIEVGSATTTNATAVAFASGTTISNLDMGGSSSTSNYINYVRSDLATKLTYYTKPDQNYLDLEYHGGESYGNVYVTAADSGASVSTTTSVKVVKDTEASSVSDKNLIVVGGSCINTVAAQILGSTTPLCGESFTAKTGVAANGYLIEVVASPVNAQKVAMLVAGYEAADTVNAVAKVKEGGVATTVGTKVVYPVAAA